MNMVITKNLISLFRTMLFASLDNVGSTVTKGAGLISDGSNVRNVPALGNIIDKDGNIVNGIGTSIYTNFVRNSQPQFSLFTFTSDNARTVDSWNGTINFRVGSGNVEPTADDIDLSNPITSGVTISLSATKLFGNNIGGATYNIIVKSTSETPLSIKEIGVFKSIAEGSGTPLPHYDVMLARSTFDEIVLNNGESVSFTVSITI